MEDILRRCINFRINFEDIIEENEEKIGKMEEKF